MRSLHYTVRIVAAAVVILALLTTTDQARTETTRSLSVLSAVEDSGGVLVTLDMARVDTNSSDEWFLEFEFDPPETDEMLRIEALLVTTEAQSAESVLPHEPVSVWEITPADRAAGLGGYVRLYLPRDLQWNQERDGPFVLRIVSGDVSAEALKAGVESVASTPATAE